MVDREQETEYGKGKELDKQNSELEAVRSGDQCRGGGGFTDFAGAVTSYCGLRSALV